MKAQPRWIATVAVLALLAGCLRSPVATGPHAAGAKPSPPVGASAPVTTALQPGAGSPAPGGTLPSSIPLPSGAPPAVDLGTLSGIVRAPATLIGDKGGAIISNNAGGIVGNNASGLRVLALAAEVPLAGQKVVLQDGAGQTLLTATTDAAGRYRFDDALPAKNLVLVVDLGAAGRLRALAPRKAASVPVVDLDLVSTMTTGYILDTYVKTQAVAPQLTLDKLPADVEAQTRGDTLEALSGHDTLAPKSLGDADVVSAVTALRAAAPALDSTLETVKRLLVVGSASAAITDGPALHAQLNQPNRLAIDASGNLFIADSINALVRKLTPDGRIVTLVGSGVVGHDDGPAAKATFTQIQGLGVDAAGNLYVAEFDRVRKVDLAGQVTTLTSALSGISSLAVSGAGVVTVLDGSRTIRRITPDGTVSKVTVPGNPIVTQFDGDAAGNLYITLAEADAVIGKLTPAGALTKVPVTSNFGFFPYQYAFGPDGAMVAGHWTTVARISPTGEATLLAGAGSGYAEGVGAAARFKEISDLAVAANGDVYVADALNNRIRKIAPDGTVTTAAGTGEGRLQDGSGESVLFGHVYSVAALGDDIIVADPENFRLRRIAPDGQVTTIAGTGKVGLADGPGASATFTQPTALATGLHGEVFVSEPGVIRRLTADGTVSTYLKSNLINGQGGLTVAPDGSLYQASTNFITRIDAAGVATRFAGTGGAGAADGAGASATFNEPHDVAMGPDGNLMVADMLNNRLRRIAPDGTVSTYGGGDTAGDTDGPLAQALFRRPWGLTYDAAGNLYVVESGRYDDADPTHFRVRRITPAGVVSTLPITGLHIPFDAIALPDGRLVVADTGNNQVKFFPLP